MCEPGDHKGRPYIHAACDLGSLKVTGSGAGFPAAGFDTRALQDTRGGHLS